MKQNYCSIKIEPLNLTKTGEQIILVCKNIKLSNENSCSVDIVKVDDDSEFAVSFGVPIQITNGSLEITIPKKVSFLPGMYMVSRIRFFTDTLEELTNELSITSQDFGICLFQVCQESDIVLSEQEMVDKYNNILAAREKEFNSGFGGDPNKPNMSQYIGLVFLKNCLITRRMRLGRYEIIPFEGLSCNDELDLIQRFLQQANMNTLTNVSDTLSRAKHGQPTAVVHFPNIFASNVNEAGQIAEQEVQMLGDLLSIYRSSYATIFGSVLLDLNNNQSYFRIRTPHYSGNLLGGSISGEYPKTIRDRMLNVRGNTILQLYLSLFKEALQEERIEFQYFRYWNLLETIARSKEYVGQPLYDWNGNVIQNRHGQDRRIQDKAEQLVFELLRKELNLPNSCFASGLSQGLITQMIPIWYRHRNCVVHKGGCFHNDISHCDRTKDNYINCRHAHQDIISSNGIRDSFTDGYLRALREITSRIIGKELS